MPNNKQIELQSERKGDSQTDTPPTCIDGKSQKYKEEIKRLLLALGDQSREMKKQGRPSSITTTARAFLQQKERQKQ